MRLRNIKLPNSYSATITVWILFTESLMTKYLTHEHWNKINFYSVPLDIREIIVFDRLLLWYERN